MFSRFVSLRAAVIFLVLFLLNAVLLAQLDQPLEDRAKGEPKLDLRFGYDAATVGRLFNAYGEDGLRIYGWNLLADTPFPVFGGLATILFALLAFPDRSWRKALLAAPLVFIVFDLIENVLLFALAQAYPAVSGSLVAAASLITQIKRTGFYLSVVVLVISGVLLLYRFLRTPKNE